MKNKIMFNRWTITRWLLILVMFGFTNGYSTPVTAQDFSPGIAVLVMQNDILGNDWPTGAPVTLTIDDPAKPGSPDYTATKDVEYPGAQVWFHLEGVFEIKPGHIVTMSNETITKQHMVTNLTVTAGDIIEDNVWGKADPGTTVDVVFFSDHTIYRQEIADFNGNWLADFSVPGDQGGEEKTLDIGPWTILMVLQNDEVVDGDHTQIDWRPPLLMAHLINYAHGFFWPCGSTLTLSIVDPLISEVPFYEETQTIPPYCNRDNVVDFDLLHNGVFLKPGHIITLTNSSITKTHVVRELEFLLVNEHTESVIGRAQPGSIVNVNIYTDMSQAGQMTVQANADGIWEADFSLIWDILPGTSINIGQGDVDGDWTQDEFGSVLAIDIMPGSKKNPVSIKTNQMIPVAILTTSTFDATIVDLTSVFFGATGVEARPIMNFIKDVDKDGDVDNLLYFNSQETGLQCGAHYAYLAIRPTWANFHLSDMGADAIQTVGCKLK